MIRPRRAKCAAARRALRGAGIRGGPQLHGPEQAEWLGQLDTEHDNLRAALSWVLEHGGTQAVLRLSAALHWFWYVRGHHREGLRWLTAALQRPWSAAQTDAAEARASALQGAGALSNELGLYDQSLAWLEEALALARRAGLRPLEAQALHGLGLTQRELGQAQQARLLLEQAGALYRQLGLSWGVSTTLNDLGISWALEGELSRARQLFTESLHLKEQLGDRQGIAYALSNLGNTLDDLAEFQRLTEQSLSIKRELGDRQGIAKSLYNLADLHINRGELATGRRLLEEALELFWQLGRKRMVAVTLIEFGKLVMARGNRGAVCNYRGRRNAALSPQSPSQQPGP